MTDETSVASPATASTDDNGAPAGSNGNQPSSNPVEQTAKTSTADPAAEPPKPKREGGFQKRISELTYERHELRRQNERLLALLEENARTASRSSTADPEPKLENFRTIEEFTDARADWRERQRQKAKPKDERPSASAEPETRGLPPAIEAERRHLFDEGAEKYADFEEVFADESLPVTPAMGHYILESDQRVELAYHLGKTPREAARISRLSPVRQIAELARIEDKLVSRPKVKPSAAPAPVDPVQGNGASADQLQPSMDFKDFMRIRNRQLGRTKS
jgi:hypothetical protein